MAEAHSSQLWDHTSGLAALVMGFISGKEIDPRKFHPFHQSKASEPDVKLGAKEGMTFLKRFYGRRQRN